MRIVMAGGSGQVGTMLARHFHAAGHQVTVLSRRRQPAPWRIVVWDGRTEGPWVDTLDGASALINLAGRSVNCRYTRRNRQAILDSRVESTRILGAMLKQVERPPAVWLNASTATIYKHSFDKAMDEVTGEMGGEEGDAPANWRFSLDVARAWEGTFFEAEAPRIRKVALRSAMTFSPDRGGVFDAFLALIRWGLGGAQGSGRQFVSWIHEYDFIAAVEFLLAHQAVSGVVNVAAPNPLPNAEFMAIMRSTWGIPFGLPATHWALEVGAWAMRTETELILKSRRVVPGRLMEHGFQFRYPWWQQAAAELVGRWCLQHGKQVARWSYAS